MAGKEVYIVLDKSYLRGTRTIELERLCQKYKVLIVESLLYELLTASADDRAACFSKLLILQDSVALVPHVGTLLRYEIAYKAPCKPVPTIAIDYEFNPSTRHVNYALCETEAAALEEWKGIIQRRIESTMQCWSAMISQFPPLASYHPGQDRPDIVPLKHSITTDESPIRQFYERIRHPVFPESDAINSDWALFNWVRIQLLLGLEYISKYGSRTFKAARSIENDIHDAEYVIMAAQAGALATMDKGMARLFRNACPKGLLIPFNGRSLC